MAKIISTKGKQFRIAMDDGTFLDQPKKKHKTIFKVGDQVDVIQDGTETHVMLKFPDRRRMTRFQKKLFTTVMILNAILLIPVLILAFSPPTEVVPKIGETLTVSDVDYKVLEVKNAAKIGSGLTVTADGRFVIILIEIKNNSNDAVSLDNGNFYLQLDGKSYSPCINCPVLYTDKDYKALINDVMNPGFSIKAVLVYDVPLELAESQSFKLKVSSGSLGLTSGLIDLSNR